MVGFQLLNGCQSGDSVANCGGFVVVYVCPVFSGVLWLDERNPCQEDGGQQGEEREKKEEKSGQENSREMLHFIVKSALTTITKLFPDVFKM